MFKSLSDAKTWIVKLTDRVSPLWKVIKLFVDVTCDDNVALNKSFKDVVLTSGNL